MFVVLHTPGVIPDFDSFDEKTSQAGVQGGELLVRYDKEYGDEDLFYCYQENECGMSRDSRLLSLAFESTIILQSEGKTLRQELEARGYDITTLRFLIIKKKIPLTEMERDQ